MKIFAVSLVFVLLFSNVYSNDYSDNFITQRDDNLVSTTLQRTIQKVDPDVPIKAWIFFTDKGFSTLSQYSAKLQEAENNLTERAKNRRLKARGQNNLVDFRDIPVYQPYIDQVLSSGVKFRSVLRWFNAVTVEAAPDQLNQIARLPFVRMFKHVCSGNAPIDNLDKTNNNIEYPLINTTLNYGLSLDQLEQINTIVAHELGFAGQDVLVCMMDTGYKLEHRAFQNAINDGRLIAQYDFVNNDGNTDYETGQDSLDQPNHGTKTWSTLGGEASGNLYGPAYKAMFCLAKTEQLHMEHHWEEDKWAAGAEWADSLGAGVISASLGYRYNFTPPDQDYTYEDMNGDSTIVTIAADIAAFNGITVVTAQGNNGSGGSGSLIAPADADSVIAVGAVDDLDMIVAFSSLGPTYDGRIKPEICARGLATVCADPTNMNSFTWASGTSLSTPLCGGAAAILLSAHPNWTPMMVREALMMTALNNASPDNAYGWGIIDVSRALFYHPDNDIIIDHEPLIYFPSGLDNNIIEAEISGGAGINSSEVYLYWRSDSLASFDQTQMTTGDNIHFEGVVPGLDEGYLQYYISAEDINGVSAVYPYGAPDRFYFNVYIDSTAFYDSFENGLYYWKTISASDQFSLTAERASSGNISITDSPYREYNNNSELILASNFGLPLYDNTISAEVSFKARYILDANNDFVYFEISTDGGSNWEQLGEPITGASTIFRQTTLSLNEYLGNEIRFRFRLNTNGSITRDGIYIDEFQVVWDNYVGITETDSPVPQRFDLNQNYPNPFNASTKISFTLARSGMTHLIIYDILGRDVRTLLSGNISNGAHEIIWNGKDDSGNDAASGIYLYKLESEDLSSVRRMIMLK